MRRICAEIQEVYLHRCGEKNLFENHEKNLKNCDKSIDIWQIWTYTVSNQSKRLLAMVLSEERIWEKS